MSFRMPTRGETYASSKLARQTDAPKYIVTDFDIYYAGAVLGLCARQRIPVENYDAEINRELTRTYPKDRLEIADTIAGMLVEAELTRQSIDPGNAKLILATIEEYLSSASQTRLTTAGHKLLDRYAAAGFRLLEERFGDDGFRYEEEFFVAYLGLLDEICSSTNTADS
ncbi:MAG: hypothetical protein AAGD43_07290 [Pseudomonadota bacterium]